MSFPTSFSSLQIHSFSSRKGFAARRPSSIYTTAPSSPASTSTFTSPALHPEPSASPSTASALSEVSAASSYPDVPSAAKGPFFESRRLSRRLPILSRKSSSVSASTTDAARSRSASDRSIAPSSPQLSPLTDDRLASTEIRPRASSETTGSSLAPAQEQTKSALSSRSVPKPPTRPAAIDRSHQAGTTADDKRRKLVRNLSRVEHSPDRRGKLAAATQPEKMHQTSSRLLRMTDDDRPFTRDFKDLFSTLMVSLPLTSHRVRFRQIDHTFTSEEAITNLGSLKFSQSNRMPDPKDPSRIVTTTTTTTFSMAKEMARSVCQKFLDARFIESADGKMDFASKSAVWQLTPKGMHILQRFCLRNGIQQDHVRSVLESPRNTMKLVILEREPETDRLSHDQATVEVIFRRFVGTTPNLKADVSASDSDSLNEYSTGLVGVKMVEDRKVGDRVYKKTFTGKAATDWLMDCSTMVDRRETIEIATLFVEYGLIAAVDSYPTHNGRFQASKSAIYYVTERGQRVAGWISSPQGSINGDATTAAAANSNSKASSRDVVRDSNTNRMQVIVRDPALRLLFREYLRHTHCEENLAFYLDVDEFLNNYRSAKRANNAPKLEFIRETLAAAYSLYNAFLAPGSPCELNIDHSLRIALASRMTRAVGDDDAMIKSLDEVANLFDQAQTTVFKLMATDSVPKFTRDPKYSSILRERNLDFAAPHATA